MKHSIAAGKMKPGAEEKSKENTWFFSFLVGFVLFLSGGETDPVDLTKMFLFCFGTAFYCYRHSISNALALCLFTWSN